MRKLENRIQGLSVTFKMTRHAHLPDQRVENDRQTTCVSRNEWAERARHARRPGPRSCSLWASRTRYDYSRGPLCFIADDGRLRDASLTMIPFQRLPARLSIDAQARTKKKRRLDHLRESSKTA